MLDPSSPFEHERLIVFHDAATGAAGAVAIHSTALGPAMGGLRLSRYRELGDTCADALRLARAMSLKSAAAGLDLGGGKAVLIDDGGWKDAMLRAARMRAVGLVIAELGGRYITAEDVGTTPEDMEEIGSQTSWVAGRPIARGGRGDPSPATALTVFNAIRVAVCQRLATDGLRGVHVGVQGVGHVGRALVELLRDAGATITLTDVDSARAAYVAHRFDACHVPPADFVTREMDVLAPCALGEVIDSGIVSRLRCAVIAGAANNPLTDPSVADDLSDARILYVPDFLANCGGIIHVGAEPTQLDDHQVALLLADATQRVATVLEQAARSRLTPLKVARDHAEAIIAGGARRLKVQVA
jgi:glutamate dehydrogenase/leucine dehydrogenase